MKIFSDLFLRNFDLNKRNHCNQLHHLFRNFSQKQKLLLAVVKNTFSKIIFATTKTFISSPQDFAVAKTFFYDDRKKQFFMFAKIFCDSEISFFATAKIFFSQLKRIISCGLGNFSRDREIFWEQSKLISRNSKK